MLLTRMVMCCKYLEIHGKYSNISNRTEKWDASRLWWYSIGLVIGSTRLDS